MTENSLLRKGFIYAALTLALWRLGRGERKRALFYFPFHLPLQNSKHFSLGGEKGTGELSLR